MRSDHRSFALDDLKATRKRQSYHQLVIEDWNVTSLTGKEHELVEEVKRYFLVWLASLRLSVVAITLWMCEMGRNSSTSALNPKYLQILGI